MLYIVILLLWCQVRNINLAIMGFHPPVSDHKHELCMQLIVLELG